MEERDEQRKKWTGKKTPAMQDEKACSDTRQPRRRTLAADFHSRKLILNQ
jgi:hypothetical protein